ncbi:MAG: hypothetical protein RTV72_16430 [Candidatus Thorarchaeota archaeon]
MTNQDSPDIEVKTEDIGFRFAMHLGRFMTLIEEEPDEDLELYGTSPRVIVILMTLVTLFFPVGGFGLIYNFVEIQPIVYGVLFIAPPEHMLIAFMYYLLRPWELISTIWMTVPLSIFNILFILQINRWFNGNTSRDIVLFYGILSMVAPSAISLALWATVNFPFVITPLPFQFFAGVALLYKFRDPDYVSPWKGDFLDWSWWTRQRHTMDDPNPTVINLTKLLLEHDADWLEGWEE